MPAFDFPASPAVGQRYDTGTGVAYVWDGVAWKGEGGSTPLVNGQRVIKYDVAGTFAYVKPANLKALQVEIFGAGGGGGGCAVTTASSVSVGGGGGGGGYARKLYQASELAASENLVLGAGGAGGDGVSTNGAAGVVSSFKSTIVNPGGGGTHGGAIGTAGYAARGGAGTGVAAGADVIGQGNSGFYGIRLPNAVPASVQPGYGGAGHGRAQYFYNAYTTTTAVPVNAGQGDGGNGAGNGFSQTLTPGARGGDAYAVFTEYYYETDQVPNGPAYDNLTIGSNPSTTSFLRVLGADNLGPHVELETGSSDSDFGPNLNFYRNVVGETEFLGDLSWYNNSNAGAKTEMAAIWATNYTITNPGDSAEIIVGTRNAGTWRDLLTLYGSVVELTQGRLLFPAVQNPSTTPNMLDDYEEGVFTPVIVGATTAGVGTYSSQSGRYTKTGNRVFFEATCNWSAHTGAGNMQMGGLPFTAGPTIFAPVSLWVTNLTYTGTVVAYTGTSNTNVIFAVNATGAANTALAIDTAALVTVAGVYQVA